jgi:hypothetical protein
MKKAAGSAQLLRPYFPGKIECLCNGHFQPRLFTIIPEPALQVESQNICSEAEHKRLLRERNVSPCWSGSSSRRDRALRAADRQYFGSTLLATSPQVPFPAERKTSRRPHP